MKRTLKLAALLLIAAMALPLFFGCSPLSGKSDDWSSGYNPVIVVDNNTPVPEPTKAPEEPVNLTPEPTDVPTAVPTDTPTPVPTATPVPSSFQFGGTTVQKGQTSVRVKGEKSALIRISAEEMDLLVALCPKLTDLVLDYCCMADYSRIGELTSLKNLQITTTTHEKDYGIPLVDIDWISSLGNLRTLTLSYNKINDIRALSDLTDLEELNLAWNDLDDDDLEWLSGLNLKRLYLYCNYNIRNVSPLASIRSLEMLHLGGCRRVTSVKSLGALPRLKELDISYCPIKDYTVFRNFGMLKTLRIYCTEFVDYYFYYDLAQCEPLEKIVISKEDTEIENALYGMIIDLRPDIEIVYWEDYQKTL